MNWTETALPLWRIEVTELIICLSVEVLGVLVSSDSPVWLTWMTPGSLKAQEETMREHLHCTDVQFFKRHRCGRFTGLTMQNFIFCRFNQPCRSVEAFTLMFNRRTSRAPDLNVTAPRLTTLPVPGSGVSGEVVSAPSSTSWI